MTVTTNGTAPEFVLGRRLTEIALGLDALERVTAKAHALDSEGLIPIYIGGALCTAATFTSYAQALDALDAFVVDASRLDPGPRRTFQLQMARSLQTAARMFGEQTVGFDERLTGLVGVPAGPVDDAQIEAIHARLDALMTARGFRSGSLAERVSAWQNARYLEPEAIPALYDELMAVAKARTDATIWPTGDYTMRLNALRGVPYAGRCSFVDGTMDINLDVRVTRSGLKHLVTHEVFPGHSTQLLSTLAVAQRGECPLDALLCSANAVTGAVQEGIGDQGIDLLDWVEDEDDAAQIEVRRLQTATGANAAWHLAESGWTRAQSVAYLQDVGFGQASWAEVRTTMAEHPFRGPFLASYWYGNETVKALREDPAVDRAALLTALYRDAHSIDSLREAVAPGRG